MTPRLLLLQPLERFGDAGLLLLRWGTGAFLISQSHDNIVSAARMREFASFLDSFGFVAPEVMAPLCVYAQFLCGFAFLLGIGTRWAGLITVLVFVVAVYMVDWEQDLPGWWPALILVFLGLLFATMGAGPYSIDHHLEKCASR